MIQGNKKDITMILPYVSGNLQKAHRPVHLANAEGAGLPEVEGGRGDEVLHRKAAGREPVPFKGKLSALRMEKAM